MIKHSVVVQMHAVALKNAALASAGSERVLDFSSGSMRQDCCPQLLGARSGRLTLSSGSEPFSRNKD